MSTATIARVDARSRGSELDVRLPAPVEDLLEAASEQGALTFTEVRRALDEAGVGPAEARRVLRVIGDRGITIGADAPGSAPAVTLTTEVYDVPVAWAGHAPTPALSRALPAAI